MEREDCRVHLAVAALAWPCFLVGFALSGCGTDAADYGKPYKGTKPAHPAMTEPETRGVVSTEQHLGVAHSRSHPPISDGSGRTSPAAGPAQTIPVDGSIEILGIRFEVPEGWVQEKPTSRMRLAQFRLPHAEGDAHDGTVTVISARGSIGDNVARWRGQFQDRPTPATRKVDLGGGLEVTVVSFKEGTFLHKDRPMAPGPGEARPGYALYAAIVQATRGQLFFKGWGPRATIDRWRPAFDELIQSFEEVR